MAAGVVSAAVMGGVRIVAGRAFGAVGVSLAGSTAHVSTQITIVGLLYVRSAAVIHLLPLLLLTALAGGLIVGIVTSRLLGAFAGSGVLSSAGETLPRTLTAWDVAMTIVLAACTVGSFVAFSDTEGSMVLVDVAGKTVEKLDLHENRDVTIRGEFGVMHIEVRQGKVRVSDADCPNRICVRTGWRSREGEVIVCVPNKTVVRIVGQTKTEVGAITG